MKMHRYIPRKLGGLVHSIWEQEAQIDGGWKILPTGFVELIFMLGPSMNKVKGKRINDAFNPTKNFCFLSGLHTKPLSMQCKHFHTMGIQMRPIAVKAIFDLPCKEVRDWAIEGEHILESIAEMEDHLRTFSTFQEKAYWLEAYLFRKLNSHRDLKIALQIEEVIQIAKRKILQGDRIKIEDLSGYSRMHTHKLFNDWVGLSPAYSLRLSQFTDSLTLLQNESLNLTEVAFESGFYDQAHFIRVFKEFTDITPGKYRKAMTPLFAQLPDKTEREGV